MADTMKPYILDDASALLDDANYWTQRWMMTAVWVRKPPR
jgi:hypothetical protein